ncbi:MAG: acyl-CoA dehydrogenase family protein [Desulfobacterales bacterium]|jgi:acyl-CoA dehydrogenase family member 9
MQADSFLINAVFGIPDLGRVRNFRDRATDEKTLAVIRRFQEINSEFPAAKLDEMGTIPEAAMERLKEIGFFGLNIPTAYGGMGLNLQQYLKVTEEIVARNISLGFTALAHLSIGIKGILVFGTAAQKEKYLKPAATGEMIFSYALTEPRHGSDAKNIETTAVLSADGQHYILNGQKSYITNANYAGGLTVFAQMNPSAPGFMGAFIVETGWQGVTIGKEMPKMGLKASSTAAIQFKNVSVPRENLIAKPGDGFKIAMTILNYGRMALGAGSAGTMRQSLQEMKKRSAARKQFGVSIDSFELIQEKMVAAKVNGYVTSALTAFTADMLMDDPLAAVAIESSHCKLFGTTRAWDTLYDALQVAGGAGYLATQPYEMRMRDFRVTTIFEGTTEIHSMYPALYMIRRLAKRLEKVSGSKGGRIYFLLKSLFGRTRWRLRFNQKKMDRALHEAAANARWIRLMVHAAIIIYGKKIYAKQFLLRRITTLSLYLYGIVAVLARIEAARRAGREVAADLLLLDYFVEESRRRTKKGFGNLFATPEERLDRKIAESIRR